MINANTMQKIPLFSREIKIRNLINEEQKYEDNENIVEKLIKTMNLPKDRIFIVPLKDKYALRAFVLGVPESFFKTYKNEINNLFGLPVKALNPVDYERLRKNNPLKLFSEYEKDSNFFNKVKTFFEKKYKSFIIAQKFKKSLLKEAPGNEKLYYIVFIPLRNPSVIAHEFGHIKDLNKVESIRKIMKIPVTEWLKFFVPLSALWSILYLGANAKYNNSTMLQILKQPKAQMRLLETNAVLASGTRSLLKKKRILDSEQKASAYGLAGLKKTVDKKKTNLADQLYQNIALKRFGPKAWDKYNKIKKNIDL